MAQHRYRVGGIYSPVVVGVRGIEARRGWTIGEEKTQREYGVANIDFKIRSQ